MDSPDQDAGNDLEARVREQYERFPFPDYSKAGTVPVVLANSDCLSRISARLFGGRMDPSNLRVLVAGGGTGEKTMGLAAQLAPYGGTVTHVDLSATSIETARSACEAIGLDNVRFVHGSLLDIADLLPGEQFDYIQSMGVLHHLPDPDLGLARLRDRLSEQGGLAIAVYARTGRLAVYMLKDAMSLLCKETDTLEDKLALGRSVFDGLPETNWLHADRSMMAHLKRNGDRSLLDAVLHTVDHAYSIEEFLDFVARSGLGFVDFCEPYEKMALTVPAFYQLGPDVWARLLEMPPRQRMTVLDLLHGRLVVRSAYLTRRKLAAPRLSENLDLFPQRSLFGQVLVNFATDGDEVRDVRFGGLKLRAPKTLTMFLRDIDGASTTRQILQRMIESGALAQSWSLDGLADEIERAGAVVFGLDLVCFCDRSFAEGRRNLEISWEKSRAARGA